MQKQEKIFYYSKKYEGIVGCNECSRKRVNNCVDILENIDGKDVANYTIHLDDLRKISAHFKRYYPEEFRKYNCKFVPMY